MSRRQLSARSITGSFMLALLGTACSGAPTNESVNETPAASQVDETSTASQALTPLANRYHFTKEKVESLRATQSLVPNNNITYHGGQVMHTVNIYYIWYGNWSAADKTILTDLATGMSASPYYDINTTYYDALPARVSPFATYRAATTNNYSAGTTLNQAAIEGVVNQAVNSGALPRDANGVYFVLSSADVDQVNSATNRFCSQYCGWHYFMNSAGTNLKYSWVGNAATKCPSSCGVRSVSPNGSPGVDAMASVLAHELEETATDPELNAWFDASGEENADKCAWNFGRTYLVQNNAEANMKLGSRNFLIQQNWVNRGGGYCGQFMKTPGDFVAVNGKSDIALVGVSGAAGITTATSLGDGGFTSQTNSTTSQFNSWAQTQGAMAVAGDFDGDGSGDIALTGGVGWGSIPIAFANQPVNTWFVSNNGVADFPGYASQTDARAVAGDFNGDGFSDIALVGPANWSTIPVAFADHGFGTFTVTNLNAPNFPGWARTTATTKAVAGDFDGDGFSDIALVGGSGWASVPIAFSNGDGTFRITNNSVSGTMTQFPGQATDAKFAVAGDFNGDGMSDIALVGGSGWQSIPVAYSRGNGQFDYTNNAAADFALWATQPGARAVSGDFNGDGRADIALAGGVGWGSIPVAFTFFPFGFSVTNTAVGTFPGLAQQSGAKLVGAF
jgi:hypothetical protein